MTRTRRHMSMNLQGVLRNMKGKKIRFFSDEKGNEVTDKEARFKRSKWDSATPSDKYFKELMRVSKNQIIWGGNYFTDKLRISRGWVFWDKKPIVPNYSDGELAWTSFDCVLRRIEIMNNKHGNITAAALGFAMLLLDFIIRYA